MRTEPTTIERMFAHRAKLFKGLSMLLCLLVVVPVLAGCGGEDETTASGPEIGAADPGDVEVIDGWSSTLAEGDVEGAAGYFAIPSTAENGPLLTSIESRADAIAFNRSLPCGAELVSARTTGDFTTATFELIERPGGDCGTGVGAEASTSFEIEDGKITEWRRIDGSTETEEPGTEV